MSLFSSHDLVVAKSSPDTLEPSGFKQVSVGGRVLGKTLEQLKGCIGELEPDQALQYATAGRWSMHQLLTYILNQTGPAAVWLTTWTITEEPMRAILHELRSGRIQELHAVLDYRIERRKPEAFQLASQIITRIKLTKCHAKVLVVQNTEWNVTVLGSANFSKNPRIEAGTIFTDKGSADFHKAWINDVIEGKEVWSAKR